jgi:hypothetical protein
VGRDATYGFKVSAVTTFSYDPSGITAFALVTVYGGERYRYAYRTIHNVG